MSLDVHTLLQGAVDMHAHLGPSVIPRSLDCIEALQEADEHGMAAIVAKDHQTPTTSTVELVNKHYARPGACRALASLVLNTHVGGLNLDALKAAIALGVRLVWLPTVSSENHDIQHARHGLWFPSSTIKDRPEDKKHYIHLLDAAGKPVPELRTIFELVAENPQVVLCTGHGTAAEADAALRLALECGCKRLVATHPGYMIGASPEQMRDWADLGVYIDIGVGTCDPTLPMPLGSVEDAVAIIRNIGSERMILTSDLGQKINPRPVPGLLSFIRQLLEHGITEKEITDMIRVNPRRLLGL